MADLIRTDFALHRERVLLINVILPGSRSDIDDPLGEIRALARAAGGDVIDEMVCKRRKPHPGMYVGTGKAEEIAQRADMNDIDAVVFDNDLTPSQIGNLEEVIERKILDRSEVILDIFASHARTSESRMQVELAQLEYTYPRLKNMWTHLERIAGGSASSAGSMGARGPGEKQIESDRRMVQKRVSLLKGRIAQIDRRKLREVKNRQDAFCVCLVGYTNAGKSTLMNLLTNAETFVADQLFATLETKTRQWNLGPGENVLLSDTVGFISNLPHHLVASFRATLEEVIGADLLLYVADASSRCVDQEILAVESVLGDLGCRDHPMLLILNKTDLINDPNVLQSLAEKYSDARFVSAVTGKGIDEVVKEVAHLALGANVRVTMTADFRNGRLMQYIAQHGQVESESYGEEFVKIQAIFPASIMDELRKFAPDLAVLREENLRPGK